MLLCLYFTGDLVLGEVSTIRLMDGFNDHSGRVEVNISGTWHAVCLRDFTDDEALVVCRQLGLSLHNPLIFYGPGVVDPPYDDYTFPSGGLTDVWYSNSSYGCSGSESKLQDCSGGHSSDWATADSSNYCGYNQTVGVWCKEGKLVLISFFF